jgi:DNA polymerase III alpha subunit
MAYYIVSKEYKDCDDMLARLCEEGLARRIPDADDAVRAQVQHELDVFKEKGIADYILTAWDIVKYAKGHGIYVGPGRGASPCSLVNYLIGITDINPLKFGLPFARFVNIERRALVYIDIDVSNCEDLQPYIRLNSFPLHIDILKLGWLQVVKNTLDSLKMKGIVLDINDIPLNDAKTLNLFEHGETAGIFQFHSPHMRKYLCQIESINFNDLVALNTLDQLMLDEKIPDYIERKKAGGQVDYFHPDLESILSETHGLLIYQEQAMQIISKMTGFSLEKGDLIRRILAKRNPERIAAAEPEFFEACIAHGFNRDLASRVWAFLLSSARRLFNKSHAIAYTFLAYQTAYLKAHYNEEYMAAYEACEYTRMIGEFE